MALYAIFLVNLNIYIRAKTLFATFQNSFQETLELSKSMINQSLYRFVDKKSELFELAVFCV